MSEVEPQAPTLETFTIHNLSLRYWFDYLTKDRKTGEYHGYLDTPCSRYGRTAAECAWYAIAGETAYLSATEASDPEEALDWFMKLAVNDHPDLGDIVREYWHEIPECLREMLDEPEVES